jgi:hypothetical protein
MDKMFFNWDFETGNAHPRRPDLMKTQQVPVAGMIKKD